MTQAYWTAVIPTKLKKPIDLRDLLVDVDATPKRRQPWQQIKASLMLALGPGNSKAP